MDRRKMLTGMAMAAVAAPLAGQDKEQAHSEGAYNIHEHVWHVTPYKLADIGMEVYASEQPQFSSSSTTSPLIGTVRNYGPSVEICTVCGILRSADALSKFGIKS